VSVSVFVSRRKKVVVPSGPVKLVDAKAMRVPSALIAGEYALPGAVLGIC